MARVFLLVAAFAAAGALAPRSAARPRAGTMDGDHDVDSLADWLRDKASIHESLVDDTLAKLRQDGVVQVNDLAHLDSADLHDALPKVTARKIWAAMDALGALSLDAAADAPSAPKCKAAAESAALVQSDASHPPAASASAALPAPRIDGSEPPTVPASPMRQAPDEPAPNEPAPVPPAASDDVMSDALSEGSCAHGGATDKGGVSGLPTAPCDASDALSEGSCSHGGAMDVGDGEFATARVAEAAAAHERALAALQATKDAVLARVNAMADSEDEDAEDDEPAMERADALADSHMDTILEAKEDAKRAAAALAGAFKPSMAWAVAQVAAGVEACRTAYFEAGLHHGHHSAWEDSSASIPSAASGAGAASATQPHRRRRRGGARKESSKARESAQQTEGRRPMAGPHAPSPSAPDSVRPIDGPSSETTKGLATPKRDASTRKGAPPSSTASTPQGAPGSGAARSAPTFKLPTGPKARLPDAHLPFEFRLGRRRWEAVELYDAWRNSAVLRDGTGDEGDKWRFVDDEMDPKGDASRVTMLLHRHAPRSLNGGSIAKRTALNARRPMAEQLHKLSALGWGTAPPTASEIVRRMVAYATDEYEWDRRQPENRGKVYHHKLAGFFRGPEYNKSTAAAPDDAAFDSDGVLSEDSDAGGQSDDYSDSHA